MEENILDDDIEQVSGTALIELKSSSTWLLAAAVISILLGILMFFACSAVLFGIMPEDIIFFGFLLGTGLGGISWFYLGWVQFWYSKAVYQLPVSTQGIDILEDIDFVGICVQMKKLWQWGAVAILILGLVILALVFLLFFGASSTDVIEPSIPVSVQSIQADTNWVAPAPNLDSIE